MVYMLGNRICDVTDGKIKIDEDEDVLKRILDRVFFKARVKVADKLMDEFYIKQGRREFTDPHMEFFVKRYLNDVYNFNIPVQVGNDPYGVNIERQDLKIFFKNINLEGVILKELLDDIRTECEGNAEFYYAILDWAKEQFVENVGQDYFSDFLSKNIFCGESKLLQYKTMCCLLENKGYMIDLNTVLNELKNCDSIYKQTEVVSRNKELLLIRNNGMTLQEYVLMNDDIQTLQILNKYKCIQIDKKDIKGESLLIKACRGGKREAISFLLDVGINVDDRAQNGDTALMLACEHNRMDIVKLLVDSGANVNEKGRCNQTALMYACEFKSIDCAQYLLKHGADVNAKTKHGSTALIYTFLTYAKNETNNLKITKLLLKYGADVNARGEYGTALIYAVKYWNKEVVKVLLKYGANIKYTDRRGEDVFKIASRRKDKGILEVLEKYRSKTKLQVV